MPSSPLDINSYDGDDAPPGGSVEVCTWTLGIIDKRGCHEKIQNERDEAGVINDQIDEMGQLIDD